MKQFARFTAQKTCALTPAPNFPGPTTHATTSTGSAMDEPFLAYPYLTKCLSLNLSMNGYPCITNGIKLIVTMPPCATSAHIHEKHLTISSNARLHCTPHYSNIFFAQFVITATTGVAPTTPNVSFSWAFNIGQHPPSTREPLQTPHPMSTSNRMETSPQWLLCNRVDLHPQANGQT